jgi:hypothetical protein
MAADAMHQPRGTNVRNIPADRPSRFTMRLGRSLEYQVIT